MFKSRLVWLLSGIAVAVGMVALAQVPISGLPNAGTQTGSEYVPEVQNGSTVKTTTAVLAAFAATAANPTGTVGLTAVNGSSTYFMRADAAPPLSQTISPTMSGTWNFTGSVSINNSSAPSWGATTAVVNMGPYASLWDYSGGSVGGIALLSNMYFNGSEWISLADVATGYLSIYRGILTYQIGPATTAGDSITPETALEVTAAGATEISDSAGNLFTAGYLDCVIVNESGNYTVALSDRGKCLSWNASATVSFPCSGTFESGAVIGLVLGSSSSSLTVEASSGTLYWANGTGATSGNRTLSSIAMATVLFVGTAGTTSTNCFITGSGVS